MKAATYLSILVSMLLVFGCSAKQRYEKKYLGKWISTGFSEEIEDSGNHYILNESFAIDYDYSINNSDGTISFIGDVKYRKSIEDSKYKHETVLLKYESLVLIFLFTDRLGNVRAVEAEQLPSGGYIMKPVPFELTFPYDPIYKYVRVLMSGYAIGD